MGGRQGCARMMAAWAMAAAMLAMARPAASQGFKHWDPEDIRQAPKTISETGLYLDLKAGRATIPEAHHFEVNSPLWSDGSAKKRWVILKPGTSIGFRELDDYWDYPDGAVFVKEFAIDTVAGDSSSRVVWETRFLINKKERQEPTSTRLIDRWHGFSYRWRKDQKEADLVPDTGIKATLRTWPKGRNQASVMKKWVFPSRDACVHCHRNNEASGLHGRSVLGFFTAQLNRPSPSAPGKNQLEDLFQRGVLAGSRPNDFERSPRWYGIDSKDPRANVAARSRAYIAANCSGCHGTRGRENGAAFGVDVNFDYHTGRSEQKLDYKPVSWTFGLDTLDPVATNAAEDSLWGVYLVTPFFPQKSVVVFRQKARNTTPPDHPDPLIRATAFDPDRNQMPPMGSFEPNEAAIRVIEEWIRGGAVRVVDRKASPKGIPSFRGRSLVLPPGLAGGSVSLLDLRGRRVPLRRIGPLEYALPESAPRGVYLLQAGPKSFTVTPW